jgi:hypothetical protein
VKPTVELDGGRVRLWHARAEDIVLGLPSRSFSALITDIPYGEVNRESSGLRNLDKGDADVVTFPLSFVCEQGARLAESVYVFCGTEQVSELRAGFVSLGMTTRLGVWEKTNPSPMNGEYLWLSSIECCVFASHERAYFSGHCESTVWRYPTEREQIHPTQKPLALMERLVRASVPRGGSVLDFCMGSGTTGAAAIRHDASFAGVERRADYFADALSRLRDEQPSIRTPLFDPKPVQRELIP